MEGASASCAKNSPRAQAMSSRQARIFRLLANLFALIILGAGLYTAAARSYRERASLFTATPTYPAGHLQQVNIVKSLLPKGAVFYIMDQPEYWQAGLWRRSLYPDNPVIQVFDPSQIHTPQMEGARHKFHISYALAAGNPPPDPGFEWKIELPAFPGSVSLVLGKLKAQNGSVR